MRQVFSYILVFLFAYVGSALAGAEKIGFTGRLVKSNGLALSGSVNLKFELYYSGDLATILAEQTINSVDLSNGIYTVELDFDNAGTVNLHSDLSGIMKNIPAGENLVIQVKDLTNTNNYDPQSVLSVPMAYRALVSASVDDGSISVDKLVFNGACSDGQVLAKDGSEFKCVDSGEGSVKSVVGGDAVSISGTSADPQVDVKVDGTTIEIVADQLQVKNISASKISAGSDGQLLVTASGASAWVSLSCPVGQYVRALNADGSVNCQADADSPHGLSAGAGIDLTQFLAGTIMVDSSTVQNRVTGVCSAGEAIAAIAQDGSVTCQVVDTDLAGVPSSCNDGELLVVNAGKYECSAMPSGDFSSDGSVAMGGNLDIGGNAITNADSIRLKDADANYVEIRSSVDISADYVLTLPANDGDNGQVLSTDGNGILSWVDPASGGGSLDSVSTSAPLASSGGADPIITISKANSATDGYLSSTDWNTFNGKQNSITIGSGAQYLKGDLSLGTFASDVAGATLTGFAAGANTAVTSTDTVESAAEKLQGQINATNIALSGKEDAIGTGSAGQYWSWNKTWQDLNAAAVGLGNVTNEAQIPYSYLDSGVSLGSSDVKVPTQNAVKTYVDDQIGAVAQSQWGNNGSDIYFNTGRVSVGGTTPPSKFHVWSNSGDNVDAMVVNAGGDAAGEDGLVVLGRSDTAFQGDVIRASSNRTSSDAFNLFNSVVDEDGTPKTAMVVRGDGRVGIGTKDPQKTLHIRSEEAAHFMFEHYGDTENPSFLAYRARGTVESPTATLDDDLIFFIGARGHDGSSFSSGSRAQIKMYAAEDWSSTGQATEMKFSTTDVGSTTSKDALWIAPNGFIGVGAGSPSTKLHVNGGKVRSSRSNNASQFLEIFGGDGTDQHTYVISSSKESNKKKLYFRSVNDETGSANGASGFGFAVGPASAPVTVFEIEEDGKVGIGTTAPDQLLDVHGGKIKVSSTAGEAGGIGIDETTGNLNLYRNSPANDEIALSIEDTNGNVGIGTQSPSEKLEVVGTIKANNFVGDASGLTNLGKSSGAESTSNVFINADSDANATGVISMKIGGDTKLQVNNTGNVGIGTTSPGAKLEVRGDFRLSSNGVNNYKTPTTDGLRTFVQNDQDNGDPYGTGENSAIIFENQDYNNPVPDDSIYFMNTGSDGIPKTALSIKGDGKVGIGTNDPEQKLSVYGQGEGANIDLTVEADDGSDWAGIQNTIYSGTFALHPGLTLLRARGNKAAPEAVQLGDTIGMYQWRGWDGSQMRWAGGISLQADENFSPSNNGASMIFRTGDLGAGSTNQKMIISSNGNVGIGSLSDPGADLEVRSGGARLRVRNWSSGEAEIANGMSGLELTAGGMNNSTNPYGPAIKFMSNDPQFTTEPSKFLAGIVSRATEAYSSDDRGGMAIDFLTSPNLPGVTNVPLARMTIDQDGKVGIGTNEPQGLLHVNGNSTETAVGYPNFTSVVQNVVNTGTSAANHRSFQAHFNYTSDQDSTGASLATVGYATNSGTGNISSVAALAGEIAITGASGAAGTIGKAVGVRANVVSGHGNINEAYGGEFFVNENLTGTIDNAYGVKIGAVKGTNKWGLYSIADAPSYLKGSLGIGTDEPEEALEIVDGRLQVTSTGAGDSVIRLKSNGTVKGHIYYDDSDTALKLIYEGAKIVLDDTGGVGIGTPSPTGDLEVSDPVGNTQLRVSNPTGANAIQLNVNTGGANSIDADGGLSINSSTGYILVNPGNGVFAPGGADGTIALGATGKRWSAVYAANGTINTSDARLKKEIMQGPYKSVMGMRFLNELRPVSYEWKKNSNGVHAGFMAQEVKSAMDKLGISNFAGWHQGEEKNDDGIYLQGLNYDQFIAHIVSALQQHDDQIQVNLDLFNTMKDGLEPIVSENRRRIASLETENEQLKDENKQMKAFLCFKFPEAPFCQK